MLFLFTTKFYMIFIGREKFWYERKQFRTEIINEIVFQMSCYHLIMFSDLVKNNDAKYVSGFSLSAVIAICMFYNLSEMGKQAIYKCAAGRKKKQKYKNYLGKIDEIKQVFAG